MRIIKNWKLIKDSLQTDLDLVQSDFCEGRPEVEAMIRERIVFLDGLLDCVVAENPTEESIIESIKNLCLILRKVVF